MKTQKVDQIIQHIENYLGCWKQFNQFLNLGHSKKFSRDDEDHFLEVKSIIAQQTEFILASVDVSSPSKDEIHGLLTNAPSLRFLSEMNEGVLRNLETQWHKIYIGWHAILGQLKVQQDLGELKETGGLFARKSA